MEKKSAFQALSGIFAILGYGLLCAVYVWSFFIWIPMLGGVLGVIVALIGLPDVYLVIIEIIRHGLSPFTITSLCTSCIWNILFM